MKTLIIFILYLITFYSCTPEDSGKIDSSPIVLSDADRIKNLETKVSSLIKDTVYKAKQIAALKKNDSIYNIRVNLGAEERSANLTRFIRDSVNRGKEMKALIAKMRADSIKASVVLKTVPPLIPKVSSLQKDSARQWVEINKLKATSPTIQIPIMQADIKNIQSKNVSQDKNIIANESSIKVLQDTITVLKVVLGSDFGLDASSRLKISQAGMNRIKVETQPQP